jgi:hypothetical protein
MKVIEVVKMDANWVLVIITGIYVIATIFICVYNHSSAKAIKMQNKELKRQFDETNCPYIDITLEVIKSGGVCLKIQNTGQKMAHNVNVKMNNDFIEQIKDVHDKTLIQNFIKSSYPLGIGQKWFLLLGSHLDLKNFNKIPICLTISYDHNNESTTKNIAIDLSQYNWMQIYDSPIQDISDSAEKIARSLEKLLEIKSQCNNKGL